MNTSKKIREAKPLPIKMKVPRLKKSAKEKFSELLLNAFPESVFLITKSGKIVYVGKQVESAFGRNPKDLEGENFSNFVLNTELERIKSKLKLVFSVGEIAPFRTEILDTNKQPVPVRVNARKLKKGAHTYALVTLQDISKVIKAEEQLIEDKILEGEIGTLKSLLIKQHVIDLNEQVEEIERLAELICKNTRKPLLADSFAKMIKTSATLISEIIVRMQDTAQIESSQLIEGEAVFSLNDLIMDIAKSFADEAFIKYDNFFIAKKSLNDNDAVIYADKFNLNKVFSILIRSALKATKGGSVSFGYNFLEEKRALEFFVTDTGTPISENTLNLFKLCEQDNTDTERYLECVKKELPVAKSIVKQLGGNLLYTVDNQDGNTFSFVIPYTKGG